MLNKRGTRTLTLNTNKIFLPKSKRSQLTIFIIIAILIVAGVVLFFMISPKSNSKKSSVTDNPEGFIQTCLEDTIKENAKIIALQGGSIEPEAFFLYNGSQLQYLCYTGDYYKLCNVQVPFLRKSIEQELKDSIKSEVDFCFNSLKENYKDSTLKKGDIKVELLPKRIVTTINNTFTYTKRGETATHKSFKIVLNNNLYEMVAITQNIVEWETNLGEAEPVNYMVLYHDLKVEKQKQTDETKIYIITDKNTGNKFQFASRSLAFPAGFILK